MGNNGKIQVGERLNICMVAHLAFGALSGGIQGHIGGVEKQTAMMARWFVAHGHKVTFVTWDQGQPDGVEYDGIKVLKLCRREDGFYGTRFFHPRWTSLVRALKNANADVYYHNCGEYVTGQVAIWCRIKGKKFIYSVASDLDCLRSLPGMHSRRERLLYRFGLRNSDLILVQTRKQKDMLREGFALDSVVVPMPCEGPSGEFDIPSPPSIANARVLWIGRYTPVKRPEMFLELARMCPEYQFDLVGPAYDDEYSRNISEQAKQIHNVFCHGAVPRNKVTELYKNAACLCCTSESEGFPNAFLEAWSHGLPVVSTFDPDMIIQENNLGMVATTSSGLASRLREIISSKNLWEACSKRSRLYFMENHSMNLAMEKIEGLFRSVLTVANEQKV
jgi:glycosyltransferase involved in cell wall biosynthesis